MTMHCIYNHHHGCDRTEEAQEEEEELTFNLRVF